MLRHRGQRAFCAIRAMLGVAFAATSLGCGHVQRSLIFRQTVALPSGRFAGPIEVELPRRADHHDRDFEIHTTLRAACTPLVRVSFPDGEERPVGARDSFWQDLLTRRAQAGETPSPSEAPAAEAAPLRPEGSDPPENPIAETATATPPGTTAATAPPPTPGHWAASTVERWPGQMSFLYERKQRCGAPRTYSSTYLEALDETGRLTLWADVPQELADAELEVVVYEIVGSEPPAPKPPRVVATAPTPAPRPTVRVDVPAKAPPPRPAPKVETPKPAKEPSATWVAGNWVYRPGTGRWVWVPGTWRRPNTTPGKPGENRGKIPRADATWSEGHWEWRGTAGEWKWHAGHWEVPPYPLKPAPKVETPKPAIDRAAVWVAGRWALNSDAWVWVDGYWSQPATSPAEPREPNRPPPVPGCGWAKGHWEWSRQTGEWHWSPGRWTAPPPKPEKGTPEVPEQEWIAGYWAQAPGNSFTWVAGYWGRPHARAETRPPAPRASATWIAGRWFYVNKHWTWSPGFWDGGDRHPPPPKIENAPARPGPDAVWLAGFWRWNDGRKIYDWVAGHWELPPGAGYVWIADPPRPAAGVSAGGHWELRIQVTPTGKVKVRP